jgi:hypothetical protein
MGHSPNHGHHPNRAASIASTIIHQLIIQFATVAVLLPCEQTTAGEENGKYCNSGGYNRFIVRNSPSKSVIASKKLQAITAYCTSSRTAFVSITRQLSVLHQYFCERAVTITVVGCVPTGNI